MVSTDGGDTSPTSQPRGRLSRTAKTSSSSWSREPWLSRLATMQVMRNVTCTCGVDGRPRVTGAIHGLPGTMTTVGGMTTGGGNAEVE